MEVPFQSKRNPLFEEVRIWTTRECCCSIVRSDLYRDFDPEEVHRALAKKGETLKRLWKKYNTAGTVNGRRPLSYRQFCRRYTDWIDNTKVTFHIQRYVKRKERKS